MLGVGVFDGHSGQEASKYVAENMWNQVLYRRISNDCFVFSPCIVGRRFLVLSFVTVLTSFPCTSVLFTVPCVIRSVYTEYP